MHPVAARLLDAQVDWQVARLTGGDLPEHVDRVVGEVLDTCTRLRVGDVVDPAELTDQLRLLAERAPSGAAASTLVQAIVDAVVAGPSEPVRPGELVDRELAERIVATALARPDLLGEVLDHVAESPLAATLATRFIGRLVADVVQTNRAFAERLPGIGSLMSLGANAAGRVIGAAEQQVESLLGDTAGKGAAFAARRLNRIVVEVAGDPTTQAAAMQIYDQLAASTWRGLPDGVTRDDVERVAGLVQDVVISVAPSEPVHDLADRITAGFVEAYAEESVATLLADVGLDHDDVVALALPWTQRVVDAAAASGDLERTLRTELEPFYASPAVEQILQGLGPQG